MRRPNPKYIRIAGIVVAVIVVLSLIGGWIAYTKREILLQKAISKAKAKAKREYNLDVKIGSAHFTGFSTVAFSDVSIVPDQRDSLLSIKDFVVKVKVMPLLIGNIKLADVILHTGHLNLTSINGVRNFDFLFRKKRDTTQKSRMDLAKLSDNLVNQVLYKIPDNLNLKNFLITFRDDSNQVRVMANEALIREGKLTSTFNINDGMAVWHFAGTMHPSDKDIAVKLYAEHQKVELPFIEKKFKLKLNLDTLTMRLDKVDHSNGETQIYSYFAARNLLINHPALSANNIVVPDGAISANVFVGENYVSVDSSSVVHLKKLKAFPYIKYTLKPNKIYELKVHTGWINGQDIFDSFPQGTFEQLVGMKVAGQLNYRLNFLLNTKDPDNVQFDSRLDKRNFRIISYGKANLDKLNHDFVYIPFEKGKPMPARNISPSNPNYTPLEDIAPVMRYSVMTAEDPSFYKNHGFVEESIRKSIATDFKERKFKRGGSGISMQLVKNAFLVRQKTLARKFEEILIVWLIENNRIMTKNRMLEVYFNIIEWGRNVYGIGEASRYYFNKRPSELTLGESIYLASIVPNPKAGLYAFEPDGSLRHRLHGYFRLIGNLMAERGYINRDTNAYGFYNVRLKESLRPKMTPVDTAAIDSLMDQPGGDPGVGVPPPDVVQKAEPEKEKEDDKKPGFLQRLFGGKKDTVADQRKDSVKLTRKQRREQRRLEKQRQKDLQDRGLL
jgi:hypothetical protein